MCIFGSLNLLFICYGMLKLEISAIKPIVMQKVHKLIFRAILSNMLIEKIPERKEERHPRAISQNPRVANSVVRLKPNCAARTVGTLMRNESVKADSLLSPLNRRKESVIPDLEIPGKAENP